MISIKGVILAWIIQVVQDAVDLLAQAAKLLAASWPIATSIV
jgi:hypothetical protein